MASDLVESCLKRWGLDGEGRGEVLARSKGKALEGIAFRHPFADRLSPVYLGDYVTLDSGTGLVHSAPAYGVEDFHSCKEHGMADEDILQPVLGDGRFASWLPDFAGMTIWEANPKIVEHIRARGCLFSASEESHSYMHCWRHKTPIIYRASSQWFAGMDIVPRDGGRTLRETALAGIEATKFYPAWGKQRLHNMIANRPDWTLSRQRQWGVPMAFFLHKRTGELHPKTQELIELVARHIEREGIEVWQRLDGEELLRQVGEPNPSDWTKNRDTLDVWFDSGTTHQTVLRGSHAGKSEFTADMYLEGSDQHRGWFHSSLLTSSMLNGCPPYRALLTHGFVVAGDGRKMSKSLGNGIDPIEVIEKYGADALRFSLEMGVSPGSDVRMSEEKIESFRNFVNKIWNASRFVLMNLEGFAPKGVPGEEELALCDKWILAKFQECARAVTDNLENFDLGLAATKLYDFVWSEFCDWYIEMAKQGLNGDDASRKKATREVLYHVLLGTLKLLHPYIPFVTEEVYGFLPGAEGMLITARWPETRPEFDFAAETERMEGVMEVIRTVRNLRAEMNVTPGRRATLILKPHAGWRGALAAAEGYFKRLAFASGVELLEDGAQNPGKSASAVTGPCELFMPLGELVDVEKELQRLEKDRKNVEGEIARAKGKLENGGFVAKAPAHLIEAEREKMALNGKLLEKLEQRIAEMEALR